MKLLVNIGTDYHLNHLPHFLQHYTKLGVERFLCGLHGSHLEEARQILAGYPVEIVACFGAVRFDEVSSRHWKDRFNDFRRQHVQPDEWCLYADADELHEYPPNFFTNLDPKINIVQGRWVERLAAKDGRLRPCSPTGNIGHQYPYGTREIFCGMSNKIMATRGDLEVVFGYHHIIGGTDTPVYHDQWLNVHHFRWDDRAQAKYQDRLWTRHYDLSSGRVPALQGVFYVDPPFPAQGSPSRYPRSTPTISVILLAQPTAPPLGEVIASIQTQTFADWELIIIANGMAASSQAAIERYAQQDDRIRMEVRDNLSLAQARQAGFELAQGKYIYCLDASYLSMPDTLQRLQEALETQPAAVVAYGAVAGMNRIANPLDILAQLVEGHFLRHGAVAIRRAALADVLALTDSDLDDQALWWLLAANSPVTFLADGSLSTPNTAPSIRWVSATNGARATVEPAPMKLAYLIVAHHQPNHLARLIQALNDENSYFFIHIDAKVPLAPFKAVVPQHANIVFLPNRVEVQWGKLSVVYAMLNLIQTAVASNHAFEYYTVLSGSDYPIKHKQEIYAQLQASDCQFLRIDRKLTNATTNSHRHFIKDLPQRKYFGNLTPYHGSMYWSLSADCVRFILDFVNNNPGYVELHNHIFAPDEVFFHTIVKHSPFADAITHDFSDGNYPNHTHHGNHFIDWAGSRNRMYLTLDERDFDDLLASAALFARKFDEQTSSRLLDLLDTHIHFVRTT